MLQRNLTVLLLTFLFNLTLSQDVGRLSRNAIPSHYDLDIVTRFDPTFDFYGTVAIELNVTVDNDENDGFLTLHKIHLEIDEDNILIEDMDTQEIYEVTGTTYDGEYNFFKIQYMNPDTDHRIKLTINYSGTYWPFFGLYLDSYKDMDTGETRYMASCAFEPGNARGAYPCFDEPDLKATFNIRVGRPSTGGYQSLANTPIISVGEEEVEGEPDYVWDAFETTPIMPTYLVAIAVNDYGFKEASDVTANGVKHRSYAKKDAVDAGYADYLVEQVEPALLQYYEDTWGFEYPLDKMDQIACPAFGGSALENWGLISFGEGLVLYDDQQTGAKERESIVSVVAHENAHQWFGDLVTLEWWDAIYLNEGFAEFISYMGGDHVAPEMKRFDSFYCDNMDYVLQFDGTAASHPIWQDVEKPFYTDFGPITYNKGSSVNRFIASILTMDVFVEGLRNYVDMYAFGNTYYDDLWVALNQAGHDAGTLDVDLDLAVLMDSYMTKKNYPLLTVDYDGESGIAHLSQSRFLYDNDGSDDGIDYTWYVPLTHTFVGDENTDFVSTAYVTEFMTPSQTEMDYEIGVSDLPLIFNIQALGYMRVNYDQDMWEKIVRQLRTDHTSYNLVNRASLLSDAFALAEAGIQPYNLPLELSQYLIYEEDYVPMSVGLGILENLMSASNSDVAATALKDFLESLIGGRYSYLGTEVTTEEHTDIMLHRTIISAANDIKLAQLDYDSADLLRDWMEVADPDNPAQNPVDKNLRGFVYCAGVRYIGQQAADFLTERLDHTVLPQEIEALYDGISCLSERSDAQVVSRLLDPILEHPWVPLNLGPVTLTKIASKRSPGATLDWLDKNYTYLQTNLHPKTINEMMTTLMREFFRQGKTDKDLSDLEKFKANRDLNKNVLEAVNFGIVGTKKNMRRNNMFAGNISDFVSSKKRIETNS